MTRVQFEKKENIHETRVDKEVILSAGATAHKCLC